MTDDDSDMIEDLFAGARAAPVRMPAHLEARLLADARRHQPAARRSFWQIIGGGWGAAGLVAATLVGVWIGAVPLGDTASWADPVAWALPELADTEIFAVSIDHQGWDPEEG